MVGELHCVFLSQLELLDFPLCAVGTRLTRLCVRRSRSAPSSATVMITRNSVERIQRVALPRWSKPVLQGSVFVTWIMRFSMRSGGAPRGVHAPGLVECVELFGGLVEPCEEIRHRFAYIEHLFM